MTTKQISALRILRDGLTKDGHTYFGPMGQALFQSWDSIHEEMIELYLMGFVDIREGLCGPLKIKCGEYLINITQKGLEYINANPIS